LRIVALFDRRIKRVHVDMNDLANSHAATIIFPSSMRVRAGRFFTGICMEQHLKVNKGVHEQVTRCS
jgi:hypothetical protein